MNKTKDKILITGVNGFTGAYLKNLAEDEYDIYGIDYKGKFNKKIKKIDLKDKKKLTNFILKIEPKFIIHLGGISQVNESNSNKLFLTNILGTKNLLESIQLMQIKPEKIIFSSTANLYNSKKIITERTKCTVSNNYALSKYICEKLIADLYTDLPIIITRPCNYTGAGQTEDFIIPKIISHFKKREKTIELGNIEVFRDYSDVRDIAQMYIALMRNGKAHDIYNLCSGSSHSIKEIILKLQTMTGHQISIKRNKRLMRKNDIKIIKANPKKINLIYSKNRTHIDETLAWMLKN